MQISGHRAARRAPHGRIGRRSVYSHDELRGGGVLDGKQLEEGVLSMSSVTMADAAMPLVLALDMGTSSCRALLYDREARPIERSEIQLPYSLQTTPDGGAEADPRALLDLVTGCVDGVLARAQPPLGAIGAVGMSCFWHSLLGLDGAGQPLTPVYYWADRRSGRQVVELRNALDEASIHQRTGCVIHSSYWPAKLCWLRETQPDLFGRVARWCSFADYATRTLFGDDLTSVPMASGTGMLDFHRVAWDDELIEATGVERSTLPPLVDRNHASSGLRSSYSERWPALANVPWYPGIGDGACANVGCGAVGPDRIALTVGTSAAVRLIVANDVGDPLTVPPDLWAYRLDHQRVVLGAALSNGGNVIDWLRHLTGTAPDGRAMVAAAALPPDHHGLTILPFLSGERSPLWSDRATGVIAGLTLHTSLDDLLRAGMEAIAYRLATLYQSLDQLANPGHQIVANGGAILSSPGWMQIFTDNLGHPLLPLPAAAEASARGAAVLALDSCAVIDRLSDIPDPAEGARPVLPNPDVEPAYREGRARQTLLQSLLLPDRSIWTDQIASRP
jgi:gluconokinase